LIGDPQLVQGEDAGAAAAEIARLRLELDAARAQQTAASEILGVIARSPTALEPVFDSIGRSAESLCNAEISVISIVRGDVIALASVRGMSPDGVEAVRRGFPMSLDEETVTARTVRTRSICHVADVLEDAQYQNKPIARAGRYRASLGVPMMHNDLVVGVIFVARPAPGPFSDDQVRLLQTFADQAAIAIENARLFSEKQEALERQTATADILKVIARSPSDAQPVFEAIAASAKRLLGGFSTAVFRFTNDIAHLAAFTPTTPEADAVLQDSFPAPVSQSSSFSLANDGKTVQIPDTEVMGDPRITEIARARGFRGMLFTPLTHDGATIGMISVTRVEPGAFAGHHVQLLQTFADQAVIAVQNARLFNETKEALEQQTATADVLKVISRSAFDLQTVLETLTVSAARLCNADMAAIGRQTAEGLHYQARYNLPAGWATIRLDPERGSVVGRALLEKKAVQIADVLADPEYAYPDLQAQAGYRTLLGVPLMREGEAIGVLFLGRWTVQTFSDRQIDLVTTFADQAVIAIENARLFDEVQQRTRELSESLETQTATSDILGVIAASPTEVQPVLDAIVGTACTLCDATDASVLLEEDGALRFRAHRGPIPVPGETISIDRAIVAGRAVIDKVPIHVRDMNSSEGDEYAMSRSLSQKVGARTILAAPLLRGSACMGAIMIRRSEAHAFSERQIALLQTFADQAVIAIQNVRLFDEVRARTDDLRESLQQQTATAHILDVISRSAFDLKTVFDAVAETSVRLCEAETAFIFRFDGETLRLAGNCNSTPKLTAWVEQNPIRPGRHSGTARAALERRTVHIVDVLADPEFTYGSKDIEPIRTVLGVPILKGEELLGVIMIYRTEVRGFNDKQIALVETFADQAALAIENAQLFEAEQARSHELAESLQQQTATAEVLKVISRSAFDLKTVLQTLVESATSLTGASNGAIAVKHGDIFYRDAVFGFSDDVREQLEQIPIVPERGSASGRVLLDGATVHIPDAHDDPEYTIFDRLQGVDIRAVLAVPMLRDGVPIGILSLTRTEAKPFTEKQIALVTTFADQAVIAMENARLFEEVNARTEDLRESLAQQTATAEVLKVISRSAFDLNLVLRTLTESAAQLCDADITAIFIEKGGVYEIAAANNAAPEFVAYCKDHPIKPGPGTLIARTAFTAAPVLIPDCLDDPAYTAIDYQKSGQYRSMLGAPLLLNGAPIGVIALMRKAVKPFTARQMELATTFADQAVIAIQNVRLFDEVEARTEDLRESLQQQTATADVLKVISRSAFDLSTVLQTLVDSAARLVGADKGTIARKRGEVYFREAFHGFSDEFRHRIGQIAIVPERGSASGRALLEGKTIHIVDIHKDPEYTLLEKIQLDEFSTILGVPMLRDGEPIGVFALTRDEARAFSDKEIELVTTFADQAAIAMENARLFDEVQQRTSELEEALQQQTATADVLQVISSSVSDAAPVFEKILESCALLFRTDGQLVLLVGEDDQVHIAASRGAIAGRLETMFPIPLSGSVTERAIRERQVVNIPDVDGDHGYPTLHRVAEHLGLGAYSAAFAPLVWEGKGIGCIALMRTPPKPFSDKELTLLETFTDQAVIAIQNARLFNEVQTRTRDLEESLQFQTASADVLKAISQSPDRLEPVLHVIVETSRALCGAATSSIFLLSDGKFRVAAQSDAPPDYIDVLRANPIPFDQPGSVLTRAAREKRVIHVPNNRDDPESGMGGPLDLGPARALLATPLIMDGQVVGGIVLGQSHLNPFTPRQIEAVETFADQAVIAISNVNLFEQVQQRTRELTQSLEDLRTAQDRLVQTEKLASLGQLTAGIAHEIKNPLNFVNNFSSLSTELLDELNDALKGASLDDNVRAEVDDLSGMLKGNLEKVVQHGRRADSIVKNMLLHARSGGGERRSVDINPLLEESLNLAYHGVRAERQGFNVAIERELDPAAGSADMLPQEIMRVLLNLVTNAFHAVAQRKTTGGDPAYAPTVRATTRALPDAIEIRIRDNGTGIPDDVKDKMFNPFFTTKPAGEGTGLGLSLSHDIVVKQHGGTIDAETEPGVFTEFIIRLPRSGQGA